MRAWITKYALTQGIIEAEVEIADDTKNLVRVLAVGDRALEVFRRWYVRKPCWHTSMEDAQRHACVLRDQKVAALKRQTTKLEKLEFK